MSTQTAIRERPILFSGEMIRAILREQNAKTQTRRLVKTFASPASSTGYFVRLGRNRSIETDDRAIPFCPLGQPGDRLWCKETFALRQDVDPVANQAKAIHYLKYRADADDLDMTWHYYDHWLSSRFMPRWASRITLEITGVRIERLQQITKEDAIAEGIDRVANNFGNGPAYCDYSMAYLRDTAEWFRSPIDSFRTLWESINGKKAPWDSDPYVWVISFKRIEP